ncbi:Ribonuclease 3 [Bienertia sinuspersici]
MGLVDTLENVAPISQNKPNCDQPQPTHQTPPTPPTYNHYQSNSNFTPSYPNYGYAPPYGVPYGGATHNSSGSMNGSGMQTNGDTKVGNRTQKSGGVKIDSIGSNIGNQLGQQTVGDVKVGNIGG